MMTREKLFLLATALVALTATSAWADDSQPANFWQTPAVEGFGKIHNLPDSAYRPQADHQYKIVFSLTTGAKQPDQLNPGLESVARAVNLYVASGVPISNLHFVAVASAAATPLALDDEHYRSAFGVANPNLAAIAALRKSGVDVAVCGQSVAAHQYQYNWIDKSVTTALSALTTITTLQQQGYALVPL
jgi:intracellular sulfur oxidation DsrE/DsrF family protein